MDKRTDIQIINNLEDLSIYRFYKCVDGDLTYLIKNRTGKEEVTIDLYNVWKKLYDEYSKLVNNSQSLMVYLLACELIHLENMFEVVPVIVNQMTLKIDDKHFDNYVKEINLWGITYKKTQKISRIIKILLNKKNKYKRKLAEYKELTEGEGKEKPLSLYEQNAKLERILKISIDVRKVNVLQWLAYFKEVELMTKNKDDAK